MEQITAALMGKMIFAAFFLLFFRSRAYYIGACVITAIITNGAGLEYVPPLWIVIDFILWVVSWNRK